MAGKYSHWAPASARWPMMYWWCCGPPLLAGWQSPSTQVLPSCGALGLGGGCAGWGAWQTQPGYLVSRVLILDRMSGGF